MRCWFCGKIEGAKLERYCMKLNIFIYICNVFNNPAKTPPSLRYEGSSACSVSLLKCRCSDTLPSYPYTLPKDHKEGDLEGRPIISTINSCVRLLSIWIAKLLNPLVQQFVTTHLDSTESFIQSIKNINIGSSVYFGSLDIVNLYLSLIHI